MKTRTMRLGAVLACVAGLAGALVASDEITLNAYMNVLKGNFDLTRQVTGGKITMNGNNIDYHIQTIPTSDWSVVTVIADVKTNGYSWIRNLTTNATRYVEIGYRYADASVTNYGAVLRFYAGEFGMARFTTNPIQARAYGGGSVDLEVWINSD